MKKIKLSQLKIGALISYFTMAFSIFAGLVAILFTGCFEASVFVGVAGLYLMLLIVPAAASASNDLDT